MQELNKPKEIIEALGKYRKQKWFEDMMCVAPQNSKFVTIIHGDVWTNNFFVNSEETEVSLNMVTRWSVLILRYFS